MPEKIYLDFNATTPVLPGVVEAASRAMKESWGNPSSGHELGRKAKDAVETARKQVASIMEAASEEIIFTSGGTESNNLAILGGARSRGEIGRHLITTRIEHPSVINPFLHLLETGWKVDFAAPDSEGIVSPVAIERLIRPDTVFVSVMLANNETGAIQPVGEIGRICRGHGICLHTDAAQALGKMPVNINKLGVDLLTVAGHKLYAPKGIGALFVRKGTELQNILYGAGQERGLRPGTEPVPLACGLGAACDWLKQRTPEIAEKMRAHREEMYFELHDKYPRMVRFVTPENALSNTLCVSFPGFIGSEILERAGDVMASTGAACHDRSVSISHVLAAMGVDEATALGMIRLSLGAMTTEDDVQRAAVAIISAVKTIKEEKRNRGVY